MDAVINPYVNVAWESDLQVPSISHAHSRVWQNDEQPKADLQKYIERAYSAGIRHTAWSNYYPSEPFYPLSDWFESIPTGLIGSPNAEHHAFTDPQLGSMHINSLGSTFRSGNPHGVSPVGINMSWKQAFPKMLKELQYADGGGITINHPQWSALTVPHMLKMLKSDPRVLGIEVANSWYFTESGELIPSVWDDILSTGQRCWGFFAPDHGIEYGAKFTGFNILLVDELDEHKCLQAYRNGAFYGRLFDSSLAFTNVSFDGQHLNVSAPLADYIQIVIDGTYNQTTGNTASMVIPSNAKYCRAEAWMNYTWTGNSGVEHQVTEKIFSNPIMFVTSEYDVRQADANVETIQRIIG